MVLKVNVCHVHQTQLSPVSKGAYREYLGKLDLQYGKLLVRGAIYVCFKLSAITVNYLNIKFAFFIYRTPPSPA